MATKPTMAGMNVEAVMRHYFNIDVEFMAEMVDGWDAPQLVAIQKQD